MSPSALYFLALLPSAVKAVQWFNGTDDLPSNVTTSCVTALQADIASCSSSLASVRPFVYPPQDYLTTLCTEDCNLALSSYESGVNTACDGQTYDSADDGGEVPVLAIAQLLRYSFNFTCLTDETSGQYCKVLAANAIGISANQSNLVNTDTYGGDDGSGGCSDCVLKSLQFQASSPFFADNGADEAYTSATSSCSATAYPLTATTALFTVTSASATATATSTASSSSCDRTYSIQSDDTCASISKSQDIGTTWLLSDNNLPAYCSGFPTNGSLCLNHSCPTYTVQANDTCTSIEAAHNLTLAQVLAWNPQLDLACSNLNMSLGLELCVGSPGTPYTAPNSSASTGTTGSGSTATAPAAIPDNVVNGTNTNCGQYYTVQAGDYCNLVVLRFGISLSDFMFLNPEINSNCTNLFAQESYCVEPVGDINSYPGYGGATTIGNLTGTAGSFSSFSAATYIPTLFAGYNRTLANGTVTTCSDYLDGADYQDDLTGTFYSSNCQLAASVYGITVANLVIWNPSLDSNASSCAFNATAWYCAGYGGDYPDLVNDTVSDDGSNATATTTAASPPGPTQSGEPADCNSWYVVQTGDNCTAVAAEYGITLTQFLAWNPAVSSDCSTGFWSDEAYCVGTSSVSSSSSSVSPTSASSSAATSPTPPAATQSGEPADCNEWYVVQTGDNCTAVATEYGITLTQFLAWNPAVSSDCSTGFWAEEAYCVGTASSSSFSSSSSSVTASVTVTPTSTTISASSTSAASPTPPAPTQAGEPSNCNAWFVPESGDSCATAEDEYNISSAQFLEWNPAVSSDCVDGFWAGEAYCVGVAS